MRALALVIAAGLAAVPASALAAPDISGEVGIVSEYITLDGFKYSDGPAAQAMLDINFGACGVNFWGSKTLKNSTGDEIDSSAYCSVNLGDEIEVTGTVAHYAFAGPNMIVFNGNIAHETSFGTLDLDVTQYTWEQNQDATQVQVGLVPKLGIEKFDLRLAGVYETGFDLPDIVMAGAEMSYNVHKNIQLRATFLAPLHRQSGDPREKRAVVGIAFVF